MTSEQTPDDQRLLGDLDKSIQRLQIGSRREWASEHNVTTAGGGARSCRSETEEDLLTLTLAVRSVLSSKDDSPTLSIPSQEPGTQSGPSIDKWEGASRQEIALLQRTRKLQQRVDKHTTVIDVLSRLERELNFLEVCYPKE